MRAAQRETVLDAAEALFLAQGFRATPIEAIAETASMSKVTVYGYFRDKDAVFVAVGTACGADGSGWCRRSWPTLRKPKTP
ncbi:MAG: TetR/AcrR family transcriptional regulator [Novosphingobium sp.]